MEIIAKTSCGCLISATTEEINEILRSVSGKVPDKLEIGQRIPAIDYASTITKVKQLGSSYNFTSLRDKISEFNKSFEALTGAVASSASLEV